MKRGIQVKFTFIKDILECTKINKVLKILNTKDVDDNDVVDVLESIKFSLEMVAALYWDGVELYVSIKDDKFYIGINGYEKFRAFRQYIHKGYTVESFTKKNHMMTRELESLSELIFHGCLPSMLTMSVSVPIATVTLFLDDHVKNCMRGEIPIGLFEKFIEKYENGEEKKVIEEPEDKSTKYVKTLEGCTEKVNSFFNDLNNILKRIPNHGRMAEEYVLSLNMALMKVFNTTVFVTKRYNNNIKYELNHCRFDNIFKDNQAFNFVEEDRVNKFVELLLQTNNISGLMIDENNKLIMPVGNRLIAEIHIAITNIVELIKVIERDTNFKKDESRELIFIKRNMDMDFIKCKIKDYMTSYEKNDNVIEFKELLTNYGIGLIYEYNSKYGTDFVLDVDCVVISHEAAILGPIIDKYVTAVRDFDFKTIDECVSEIPEGIKFNSVRTDNKIIIKYGRGEF